MQATVLQTPVALVSGPASSESQSLPTPAPTAGVVQTHVSGALRETGEMSLPCPCQPVPFLHWKRVQLALQWIRIAEIQVRICLSPGDQLYISYVFVALQLESYGRGLHWRLVPGSYGVDGGLLPTARFIGGGYEYANCILYWYSLQLCYFQVPIFVSRSGVEDVPNGASAYWLYTKGTDEDGVDCLNLMYAIEAMVLEFQVLHI
ncbi:hypothetical protein AK812_SmicGene158 [Symbiodinium microadriaticum]|uniref:Uncharacterized protein n=1 Tax=Symbiodinium microadriaticum TaxID=2951 RepID=A0A1Q9F7B0_SYMMI|nr:hypothetical protein AK812_SmicGene158 [Symbiodinium microadriaticum]